jgi:ribosomal-protein-alanine N-acetyltransferase
MATRSEVTFETERLLLREPRAGDASLLCDYYARNAARFERWEPARSADVAVHAAWIAAVRADADRTGHAAAFLAFDRNAPTALAGTVNLDGFSAADASAMLSYGVDAVYEGRGIASEAVARAVRYAFDELRIRTISAYYDPANARSEQLLVRLGFTLAGRTPVVPGLEHLMRSSAIAVLARS